MRDSSFNPENWFWTVKYLRTKQAIYWIWRKFQFRAYKVVCPVLRKFGKLWPKNSLKTDPIPSEETISKFYEVFTSNFVHLTLPLDQEKLSDLLLNRFTFLNVTCGLNPINWTYRYNSHLWNYHLHYFDYALWCARAWAENQDEAPMRRCQNYIEWWIKQTDVGRGDGWDPYPISLRIVNWIYAYVLIADTYDDRVFIGRWRVSIYQQLDFLSRHLEYQHMANHLLKNLKALVIGNLFFGQKEQSKRWEALLWREFEEQILPDGGHYERSPMYHAQVLADFLECYALLNALKHFPPSGGIKRGLELMTRFMDDMCFPDRAFARFNDSTCNDETWPPAIIESAMRIIGYKPEVRRGVKTFHQTGYYVWESLDLNQKIVQEKIIVDAGPPSVPYAMAHAHCDLLSYELWLCGRLFIVDSGVHGYEGDRFREYCRSTRAHNTVMFDGREQSRVWSCFRVAQRAKLIGARASGDTAKGNFNFYGEYQTYDRGSGGSFDSSVTHRRHITRSPNGVWMIEDIATKGLMKKAESFIHLHPDWTAVKLSEAEIMCECGEQRIRILAFAEEAEPDKELDIFSSVFKGSDDPVQGWWFSDFGVAWESYTIRFDFFVKRGDKFGYRILVEN